MQVVSSSLKRSIEDSENIIAAHGTRPGHRISIQCTIHPNDIIRHLIKFFRTDIEVGKSQMHIYAFHSKLCMTSTPFYDRSLAAEAF